MKKSKKVISSMAILGLLFAGTTVVHAKYLGNWPVTLIPENAYAQTVGPYVKAVQGGAMLEDHSLLEGSVPWGFKAELERRTAWYEPNVIEDQSVDFQGWNRAYNVASGNEYRTYFKENVNAPSRENSLYTNY